MRLHLHPYELARLAECASPDSENSAGARFLLRVQDTYNEHREDDPEAFADEWPDGAHEVADDAANLIYSAAIWAAFVDVAAYRELPELAAEYGADHLAHVVTEGSGQYGSPDSLAVVALYAIAERLAYALHDEAEEGEA